MSYHYRGRYTHNYQEYQRWRSQGEAEDLRRTSSALSGEADRLRSQLSSTREELHAARNDVRSAARAQAQLEERQRTLESVQQRVVENQRAYEERATQRQSELEQEIREAERLGRAEIQAAEQRTNQQISELRTETAQQISQVQNEISTVQRNLDSGLSAVRAEVRETRQHLEGQIGEVRKELEAERRRKIEKEGEQAGQARSVVEWIEQRMAALTDLDALSLQTEGTRVRQHLERARETLGGRHPEMAMPVAESAFASFQTAYFESERRRGVIEGIAEHVSEVAAALEEIYKGKELSVVFKAEAEQLESAAVRLRSQAEQWRTRPQWAAFEVEREQVMARAGRILVHAIEFKALVPGLVEQLRQREQRAKEAAEVVAAVMGKADSFEMGYANADDVKSPRLLRARIGTACVDTYLHLDGTYRVDAYGFATSGQCGEAAERMGRELAERWQVTEQRLDVDNRQEPEREAAPGAESWRGRAAELSAVTQQIVNSAP